jgi:hypothetical protein
MLDLPEIRPTGRQHPYSWRTARRVVDCWISLCLLTYLFGQPFRAEFGVAYAAKRHAEPVMQAARERGRLLEQIRHLEEMLYFMAQPIE